MVGFVAVATRLNFSEAGQDLGLAPSTLSRRIAALEMRLGCRLFQRTTRQVTLTEAGEQYLERCREIIERADEADAAAMADTVEPRGTLKIALPNVYGQKRIAPLLPEFLARHPRLSLQLLFDDNYADLVDRRLDVAVRIGDRFTGDFVVRRLTANPRYLCAAPSYLARRGTPRDLANLVEHDCLHFSPLVDGKRWRLSRGEEIREVTVSPLITADNAEALRIAAVEGCGIALLAEFLVADDLAAGHLVRVLEEWTVAESHIHVAFPATLHLPLKTRAFVDFLVEKLAD
nr:LysR family transcriptional regulator [Qipengyuania qiaonensis]